MNESPVTPYKRLSVKCMLSLEKPFVGAELKHLCEVRVRLCAGYVRGPEEPTGHIRRGCRAGRAGSAPAPLGCGRQSLREIQSPSPGLPEKPSPGLFRSPARSRAAGSRMLPVRDPKEEPKALLPPNITDPPCTDTCHRL